MMLPGAPDVALTSYLSGIETHSLVVSNTSYTILTSYLSGIETRSHQQDNQK